MHGRLKCVWGQTANIIHFWGACCGTMVTDDGRLRTQQQRRRACLGMPRAARSSRSIDQQSEWVARAVASTDPLDRIKSIAASNAHSLTSLHHAVSAFFAVGRQRLALERMMACADLP